MEVIEGRNSFDNHRKYCSVCNKCGKITPVKFTLESIDDDEKSFFMDSNERPMRFTGICHHCGGEDARYFGDLTSIFYIVDKNMAKITSAFVKGGVPFKFMYPGFVGIFSKGYEDTDDIDYEIPSTKPIITISKFNPDEILRDLKINNEDTSALDHINDHDKKLLLDLMESNIDKVVKLFSNIKYWEVLELSDDYAFVYDIRAALKEKIPNLDNLHSDGFIKKLESVTDFHYKQCDIIGETLLKSLDTIESLKLDIKNED